MKYCQSCHKTFQDNYNYCIYCGKYLQSLSDVKNGDTNSMVNKDNLNSALLINCPDCMTSIPEISKYCHYCGYRIKSGRNWHPQINRISVLIVFGILTISTLIWVGLKYINFPKSNSILQIVTTKTAQQTEAISSLPTKSKDQSPTVNFATETPIDMKSMVLIPGGSFIMGGSDSDIQWHLDSCNHYANCDVVDFNDMDPKHKVELDPYLIDIHEVTNSQYRQCVDEGVCGNPDQKSISKYLESDYFSNVKYNDYPVVAVSWNDATTYCQWDGGKQLPTEAQWEKAAKGPEDWYFPWATYPTGYKAQTVFGGTKPLANFCDVNCPMSWKDVDLNDGYKGTSPVMNYTPNGFGLFDIVGNVTEWTQDFYDEDYYSSTPEENPINLISSEWRVTRGGGWNNGIYYLTSIFRSAQDPNKSTAFIGFRCVKSQ